MTKKASRASITRALLAGTLLAAAKLGANRTRPPTYFPNNVRAARKGIVNASNIHGAVRNKMQAATRHNRNMYAILNIRATSVAVPSAFPPILRGLAGDVLRGDVGTAIRRARDIVRESSPNSAAIVGQFERRFDIDVEKMAGMRLLSPRELVAWMGVQATIGVSRLPAGSMDAIQRMKTLDLVSSVLKTNPKLTAEKDPYGIAPGTHLAMPYEYNATKPFVGQGFGILGRQRMRMIVPGWNQGRGYRALYALFHHAVYVGNGTLMHVGGGGVGRMLRGTHTNFVGLDPVDIASVLGNGLYIVEHTKSLPRMQIMYNLINAPGGWKYDRMTRNCEHFATEVVTGVPMSAQVERYIRGAGLGVVMVAVLVESTMRKLANRSVKSMAYVRSMFKEAYALAKQHKPTRAPTLPTWSAKTPPRPTSNRISVREYWPTRLVDTVKREMRRKTVKSVYP